METSAPVPFSADRWWDQFRLSFMWFAGNTLWAPMITTILPFLVLRDVGSADKGVALSLVGTLGPIVASVVHPLGGWASDRTRTRFGRRRPYVLAGGIVSSGAILWLAFGRGFYQLVLAVMLLQLAYNVGLAAYQAYIPEIAPGGSRGKASGFLGLMSTVGSLVGSIAALLLLHGATYVWLLVLMAMLMLVGTAVTVWGLPEAEPPPSPAVIAVSLRAFLSRYRDFGWVLLTRALVMLTFYTLLYYLAYYVRDVVGIPNYAQATNYAVAVTILTAALCTLWTGRLSDRIGRRGLVCASGLAMGIAALAFLGARSLPALLVVGVLFGAGYGTYLSVDWALITDVLPDSTGIARDMGFWGLAITVPQVLSGAVGGLIFLLYPPGAKAAYMVLFSVNFIYAALGSVLVWQVRGVR